MRTNTAKWVAFYIQTTNGLSVRGKHCDGSYDPLQRLERGTRSATVCRAELINHTD